MLRRLLLGHGVSWYTENIAALSSSAVWLGCFTSSQCWSQRWTWECVYVIEILISVLLDMYAEIWLLKNNSSVFIFIEESTYNFPWQLQSLIQIWSTLQKVPCHICNSMKTIVEVPFTSDMWATEIGVSILLYSSWGKQQNRFPVPTTTCLPHAF